MAESQSQRKKLTGWQWAFLVLLIVSTVWVLVGHRQTDAPRESRGKIFGTYYTIKYEYKEPLDSLILAELQKVDQSLSMFNPQSTISQINNNQSDKADSLLAEVWGISQHVSVQTGGAFDVTVAPLVNAWGFGLKNSDSISARNIDSLMQFVGYEKVSIDRGQVVKADPRVKMDFSAVAKGYGVDCVAKLLNANGIENYMVEIGGEVVVRGKNPKGKLWTIEVTRPTDVENRADELSEKILLQVSDVAMATSGNYRRFYVKDGKRYAHTIDSHTGYPVQHSLLSATVLASDCATADAYATSFMVMGLSAAQQFVAAHPELSVYLIYADETGKMNTWASKGMENYMKRKK